ncbi:Chitinase 1 [Mortierella hygrophila]|uniref:chitinase n=1 Tax=Mortierella hygrophila TaxID=979708 RepID=A0A9P6FB24_9FUNG|nr:Chitinase 1 [Mortierella hygrophila]
MKLLRSALYAASAVALLDQSVCAFDPLSRTNVVNYWGQNSVSYAGGKEGDLVDYCQDGTVNVFALAFISQIQNGLPILNLANHCEQTFPGTTILNCPRIGQDIKACQASGKAIVISIGGASGSYSLPDAAAGRAFADQIWDLFLGGSSGTRPFGDAVLDGVDLDLESGQNAGYVAFVDTLRTKFAASGGARRYYITAAPQCPYPDTATKDALEHSWFDLVWVQFYNNYCGVNSFGSGSSFNFATWNNWATAVSLNKNVRILLGIPGGPGAAGTGVIDAARLNNILAAVKSYSNFGGVMMWDAGISRQSGLAVSAARFLRGSSSGALDTHKPLDPPAAPTPPAAPAPPSATIPTVTPPQVQVPTVTTPAAVIAPEPTDNINQHQSPTPAPTPAAASPPSPPLPPAAGGTTTTTTLDISAAIPTLNVKVSDDGQPTIVRVHVHNSTQKSYEPEWVTAWDWQGHPYKIPSYKSGQPPVVPNAGFDIVVETNCRN